jgi:hypothetical protein
MGKRRKQARGLDDTRRQILIFFSALIVVEAILLFIALGYKAAQSDLHRDERILLGAREIAHNASVKSNELHMLAKDAAASGDPRDIRDYAARARPQPSDADYEGGGSFQIILPFLRQISTPTASFKGDEVPKFEETIARMREQFTSEEKAINALKGFFQDSRGEYAVEAPANPKLATQILTDPEYEKNMRAIQSGFSAFLSQLNVRLFAIHKESSRSFRLNFLIALASILLVATPVAGLLLYRSANATVRKLKINAHNLTDEIGRVNNELRGAVASREQMRRQLESLGVAAIPGPAAAPPVHDDSQPEFNDFLTRLP